MHRRPPSGGGKRNSRLALLATVISSRAKSQRSRIERAGRYVYCLPRGVYAANYLPNPQNRYSCRANFSLIVNAACLNLRPTMIHFEARGKVAALASCCIECRAFYLHGKIGRACYFARLRLTRIRTRTCNLFPVSLEAV
jgi:hypothetical protein